MPDYFLAGSTSTFSVGIATLNAVPLPVVSGQVAAWMVSNGLMTQTGGSVRGAVRASVLGLVELSISPIFYGRGSASTIGEGLCYLDAEFIGVEAVITAKGSAAITIEGQSPRLLRIATQVYNLFGMEVKSAATISFARPRVLEIINSALQIVYSAAKAVDYFARATMPLTFAPDQSSQVLDSSIQSLLGPVRLADSKQPLSPVETINDFHSYDDIYGTTASSPRIYFLDRVQGVGQDSAGLTLRIAPPPTVGTMVEIEYAREAPRFSESDLLANAPVPMPHAYVESLLLPIVKHIAASDTLFKKQELRSAIAADYQRARLMLGIVDPEPTPTARPKPKPMEVSAV